MIKYDYVKLTANKKDYYFLKDEFRKLTDSDEEYNPIDFGIQYLRDKNDSPITKLKFRKSDTHAYATKEEIAELKSFLTEKGLPLIEKEKKENEEYEKRYAEERKKNQEKALEAAKVVKAKHGLPFDLIATDLVRPEDSDQPTQAQVTQASLGQIAASYGYNSFKMYLVKDWGWCVPTLHIGAGHRGNADRAYAVRVSNGECVRVGNGPHVLSTTEVYLKKSNGARLKPLLELMRTGAIKANETRDRISTRRMQSRRTYW